MIIKCHGFSGAFHVSCIFLPRYGLAFSILTHKFHNSLQTLFKLGGKLSLIDPKINFTDEIKTILRFHGCVFFLSQKDWPQK